MEEDEYNFDWDSCLARNVQIKCGTDNREPAISTHDIEAEKKCELIQLIDTANAVKLTINEEFTSQWEQLCVLSTSSSSLPMTTMNGTTDTLISPVNNNVYVISLLGDSTDGKSFLLNHLLPTIEKNRPIVVDDIERVGSTTANITCFQSTSFLPESLQTNTLFLDYEGEKGSYQPHLLKYEHTQWTFEHAEKRRKAVSEHFPKLAYTLSNVIILLSRDDFVKYDYISRCYDFAERATRKLQQNPYKPILILVHNYCSHSLLQPVAKVTQQFFQTHLSDETKKLQDFFEAVYCVRIPSKMHETTDMIHMNEMFHKQVTDLKNLLIFIQKKYKKEHTLPQIVWLDITKHITGIVSNNGTVMMHMLLRQILVKDPGDTELNTILFLFNILYNKRDIHSVRWFEFCRNFAINALARAIAIRFVYNMKYIPDGNLKNMTVREEARICLDKLWTSLDEFRPCTALYMGNGYPQEKDYPVFCLQHKGVHQQHRTSKQVYGTSLFNSSFLKIPRLWSIYDVWNGEFESNDHNQDVPSQQVHDKFNKDVDSYIEAIKHSDDALYRTFNHLLYQYNVVIDSQLTVYSGVCCCCFQTTKINRQTQINNNTNVSNPLLNHNNAICLECDEKRSLLIRENYIQELSFSEENKDQCVICMSAPQIIMFDPCHHQRFCETCANIIHKQFGRCPLCRANILKRIVPK